MIGVAVIAVLVITIWNIRYVGNQRTRFIDNIGDAQKVYLTRMPVIVHTYPELSGPASSAAIQTEESGDESAHRRLTSENSGKDSIRAADFAGKTVILNFWATWSETSASAHRALWNLVQNDTSVVVIAAGVKDNEEFTRKYLHEHAYPFIFVNGSDLFHDLMAPGLPVFIVFGTEGELAAIRIGFRNVADLSPIREILNASPDP